MRRNSAQTTVEYLLMISISVSFFLLFLQGFVRPTFQKLNAWVGSQIEERFFKSANLHKLNIGR